MSRSSSTPETSGPASGAPSKAQKAFNPFYPLLIAAGLAFAITATAYGVMILRKIEPVVGPGETEHRLIQFMDEHGFTVLMVELGVLAFATFAAISTDSWWIARQATERTALRNSSETPCHASPEGTTERDADPD